MEEIWNELKPSLLMVLVQLIFTGVNIMYKLSTNYGMDSGIVIAYRFMFGTLIMLPIALIFERKSLRNINGMIVFQSFLCGLLGGSLAQNLYLQSLVYTSATFVSAIINLGPAVTFILAVCFKMEKLAIRSKAGKAKVCGTLIGIGGALVFTFYKGIDINIWSANLNLLKHRNDQHGPSSSSSHDNNNFIVGAFLGLLSCISFSSWFITQAKMNIRFPYLYSSTALMCVSASIQGVVFALCTVRDWDQWKLGWDVRLLAVTFLGILGTGLWLFLISLVVRLKGPIYASIFNPVGLVFVAILGSFLLDEKIHLGSIIGGLMIVCGVYVVLWGKAKEMKHKNSKTLLVQVPTKADHEETNESHHVIIP